MKHVQVRQVVDYAIVNAVASSFSASLATIGAWGKVTALNTIVGSAASFPAGYLTYISVAYLADYLGSKTFNQVAEPVAILSGLAMFVIVPIAFTPEYELALLAASVGVVAMFAILRYVKLST